MISLREATVAIKRYLEGVPVEGLNDLIIVGVEDLDDLWVFHYNNAWVFLETPWRSYPGIDPLVVFKADGAICEVPRFYGHVAGSREQALASVRREHGK